MTNKKDKKTKSRSSKSVTKNVSKNAQKTSRKNGATTPKKNRSNRTTPATKNVSDKVFKGNAIRSRDEYFYNGKPKDRPNDNPNELYRVAYVIETNSLDELAVVKSTTSKGHYLKSKPDQKFKANVYILDNDGSPIKISPKGASKPKFVRSSADDLTQADVEHIRKRTYKHPDSNNKIAQLKSRSKPKTRNGKKKK